MRLATQATSGGVYLDGHGERKLDARIQNHDLGDFAKAYFSQGFKVSSLSLGSPGCPRTTRAAGHLPAPVDVLPGEVVKLNVIWRRR